MSQLPQSPLTDPKLNAARYGYKKEKPRPDLKKLSGFQLKLQKNPYAHAIASPIRHCLLTGARLPKDFLLDFHLATHPETGAKWHLPRLAAELAGGKQDEVAPRGASEERQQARTDNEMSAIEDSSHVSNFSAPTLSPPKQLPPRMISGTHFLSSYPALQSVSRLRPSQYRNILPYRWRDEPAIKTNEIVWREDMAEFTLELLRKRVVRGLERVIGEWKGGYVAACERWEMVERKQQISACLWLGSLLRFEDRAQGGKAQAGVFGGEECENAVGRKGGNEGPPPYAMVMYRGKHIPVYNLQTLIGQKQLEGLREKFPKVLGKELAVVRRKKLTVQLQMNLWTLMGYLAESEHSEGL
ncbi:MAG: hypothetical protein Q9163_000811 [Psora crenata]